MCLPLQIRHHAGAFRPLKCRHRMNVAQKAGPRAGLSWIGLLVSLAVLTAGMARADTWAPPSDATYHSEDGRYKFSVHILDLKQWANGSTGVLRRKQGEQFQSLYPVCREKGTHLDGAPEAPASGPAPVRE